MSQQIFADGLVGLIALAAAMVIWFGPLRSLGVDWARERIFAARERLFDAAVAGYVSFDDPGYRVIRIRINDYIRFAYIGSLQRMFFHQMFGNETDLKIRASMTEVADGFSDHRARDIARATLHDMDVAFVILYVLKSPFVTFFMLVTLLAKGAITRGPKRFDESLLGESLRLFASRIEADISTFSRART